MGAVYFCVTVVTTIGYGTYTPETEAGKGFLLFYALVGIPAFIVMLTIMSETLLSPINMLIKVLSSFLKRFDYRATTLLALLFLLWELFVCFKHRRINLVKHRQSKSIAQLLSGPRSFELPFCQSLPVC